jgi:hypothetical protein
LVACEVTWFQDDNSTAVKRQEATDYRSRDFSLAAAAVDSLLAETANEVLPSPIAANVIAKSERIAENFKLDIGHQQAMKSAAKEL